MDEFDFQNEIDAAVAKHKEILKRYSMKVGRQFLGKDIAYSGKISAPLSLIHEVLPDPNNRPYWHKIILTDVEGKLLAESIAADTGVTFDHETKPEYYRGFVEAKEIDSGIIEVSRAKDRFERAYAVLGQMRKDKVGELLVQSLKY
jgi:hypothetical protein